MTGANPGEVAIADMNLDGHPRIWWWPATTTTRSRCCSEPGPAASAPRPTFATSNDPFNLAVGDVNLDGRPDVVTNDHAPRQCLGAAQHHRRGGVAPTLWGRTDFCERNWPHRPRIRRHERGWQCPICCSAQLRQPSCTYSVLTNSTALGASTPASIQDRLHHRQHSAHLALQGPRPTTASSTWRFGEPRVQHGLVAVQLSLRPR